MGNKRDISSNDTNTALVTQDINKPANDNDIKFTMTMRINDETMMDDENFEMMTMMISF